MSKICPLFSGSSGNCTYIETRDGAILIDAGVSFKRIKAAVESVGGDLQNIRAVCVTHEHSDHITGLKTLLNKTEAVLYASTKTLETLASFEKVPSKTKVFEADKGSFSLFDMEINRFATSHDCEGSSGYNIILPDGKKFTLCTDLGVVTDQVRTALMGSDLVLIESNHDIEMLRKGPYPNHLKVRIMSDKGHISNVSCAAELKTLLKGGTERFILGHLSRNNNTPLIARSCAEAALMDLSAENGKDYLLSVAAPEKNGVTIL